MRKNLHERLSAIEERFDIAVHRLTKRFDSGFNESDHPRDDDGKFTSDGGSSGKLNYDKISKYVTSVPVSFKKNASFRRGKISISETGDLTYEGPFHPDQKHVNRAIEEYLRPFGENVFVRSSPKPQDYDHIKNGTHRGSKNHATGEDEGGISASYTAEFPAKYMYLVTGKRIGDGSDGEPLLETGSVKTASKRMSAKEFGKIEEIALERRKKELGLSEDDYRALVSGNKRITQSR